MIFRIVSLGGPKDGITETAELHGPMTDDAIRSMLTDGGGAVLNIPDDPGRYVLESVVAGVVTYRYRAS